MQRQRTIIASMTKITKEERQLEKWQVEDAARLRTIYDRYKEGAKDRKERFTLDTFAEQNGISSGSMVWQYLTAHRPLNIEAAAAFARGLKARIEDFSPHLAEKIAQVSGSRQVEAERKLQWVDDDEAKLLSLFRSATDQGRATMLTAGETAPKALSDELAAYKQSKDRARG